MPTLASLNQTIKLAKSRDKMYLILVSSRLILFHTNLLVN